MTWATFYLVCFVFGFAFSAISLLSGLGHLHLPLRWHLPHGPLKVSTGASAHAASGAAHGTAAAHTPAVTGGAECASAHTQAASGRSALLGPVNSFTVMAFLTWFGGTGFLLTEYSKMWFALALLIASLSGIAGSAIIFAFLTRVALAHAHALEPEDFEMAGVLGRLSVTVRAGGTGEIIYSQGGTRHACAARSEDGGAIPKGSEVVVTRYEKGIAYVRRWEEMAG
jgi:membrane protein implicated in regulation of membrane protease activity